MISDPLSRWKSRIGEGSLRTYLPWFEKFKNFSGKTAEELVTLSSQESTDLVIEFYDSLKKENYSSKTCSTAYGAIRSFFTYNNVRLEKMGRKFSGWTQFEGSRGLTSIEVFRLIEAISDFRDKGAVGVCFQGGQRDSIVVNLKIKNIMTKDWENAAVVVFDVSNFLPDEHGRNVNKREVKYRFAVLNDVARFIVLHLDERRTAGEKIGYESWLFRSRMAGKAQKINYSDPRVRPITANHLNKVVILAADKIGIQQRVSTGRGRQKAIIHAHRARDYFKSQTRLAGVDGDLRNFMMGHQLAYGGAYDKFSEGEIVAAMEQARSRLALSPQPLDEVERKRQNFLDAGRVTLTAEKYAELEKFLLSCKSTAELETALDSFKNGTLEKIKEG